MYVVCCSGVSTRSAWERTCRQQLCHARPRWHRHSRHLHCSVAAFWCQVSICWNVVMSDTGYWCLRADIKGSDNPSLGSLLMVEKGWVPVDVISIDWQQEGHPATKTLHKLPLMECTFPSHQSSFFTLYL